MTGTTRVFNYPTASSLASTDVLSGGQGGAEAQIPVSVLAAAIATILPLLATGFTQTTGNYIQPAVGANVSINFGSTKWMVPGQVLYGNNVGFYTVATVPTTTNAVLTNLGANGSGASVVAPGATVTAGAWFIFGGLQGQPAYTVTSASFTQPAVGSNVTVQMGNVAWAAAGMNCFVGTGGSYSIYSVNAGANTVTLTNLGSSGNATVGATVPTSQNVTPTGAQGPAGANAYTTTTASFTQPAVNSNVSVSMVSTGCLVAGENAFVGPAGGYYQVASITSSTVAVLTNLGSSGNASPGATVPTSQQVGSAGPSGASGIPSSTGNANQELTNNGTTAAWGLSAAGAAGALAFLNQ